MMEEMLLSMLQKMTGLTPEQMQSMANKAMALLENFSNDMIAVKSALERIENKLAEQNGQVIDVKEKVIDYAETDNNN